MSRRTTLIVRVADLEELIDAAGPDLPGWLRRFLRQGRSRRLDPAAGGTDLAFDQPLPVAPLTRRLDCPTSDAREADGYWLRADPIGLRADIRAVWVFPGQAHEPARIEPILKALLDESGFPFELPHPRRGYLKLPGRPNCRFLPPQQTAGKSLDDLLPEGPEAPVWRRLGNEVQMVLHQASEQADAGFQGLWFWGGGSLDDVSDAAAQIDWLVSDDIVLRAAADWKTIDCRDFASLTSADWPKGQGLIDWTTQTAESAVANIQALEAFLKPAIRRLRWGSLSSLTLAGRETAYSLRAAGLWWPLRS